MRSVPTVSINPSLLIFICVSGAPIVTDSLVASTFKKGFRLATSLSTWKSNVCNVAVGPINPFCTPDTVNPIELAPALKYPV